MTTGVTIARLETKMIYVFGDYELDTRVYELRRAGTVRPVEPQVFDVLAYLVQHRDRVISKEELLEKLWPDRFVSETTLTSRLKEARKAVGDTGKAQSVIRTQRGRGYRFVAKTEERAEAIGPGSEEDNAITGLVDKDRPIPVRYEGILTRIDVPESAGFVGRREELHRLATVFDRALQGKRQVVFVTGEAGAGKTTLVDRFLSQIPEDEGVLVARGQCVEYRGSGEPYMPLLDALSRVARGGRGSDDLVALLKKEAPSWVIQMAGIVDDHELEKLRSRTGAGGERMLRELGMMVDSLTNRTPLVLLLEDLHWSDYATLDAIDVLARQLQPARLMIVGTWRPSDVKAARHPVYALTQELRARGQCEVVPLPLLGTEELASYLRLRFGDVSFGERLSSILHDRTAGNALFVRNLVESWIERGRIVHSKEGWSLEADLDDLQRDVPDTLQHLIENQISELDPEQLRVLEAAAVVGRTFPVSLISGAIPAADDDVERECERLSREANIIRAQGSEQWGDGTLTSRYGFVHDLYVDVFYDRIPTARRTRLHAQVGRALEQAWHGREGQRSSELALHFRRAQDRVKGPRYLELAAEQAVARNAYREAVDHLSAALEIVGDAPPSAERDAAELQFRCRLAPALVATRGWTDSGAEQNYLRSRELAEDLGERELLSQTLYGLANMYEFRGEYELAERITSERISLDTSGTCTRALESHELLTCSLLHQGRYVESVRHGEKAMEAFAQAKAEDLDSELQVVIVQAHGWISGSLHFAGRADDALDHSRQAIALAEEYGNDLARASASVQAAFLRFYRREEDECNDLASRGREISSELRFPFHLACSRVLLGWARAGTTDLHDAIREVRSGIRVAEAIGARMDLPVFHAILAEVHLRSGEAEDALGDVSDALAIADRGRTFFYVPELWRLRGVILTQLGPKRRQEAIEATRRSFDMAREQGCPLFALRAARDLTTLDTTTDWISRLREIYESFEQGLDTGDLREVAEMLR